MIIDGFVRKQLLPVPPEVELAAGKVEIKKENADTAADAIEMYMTLGISTKAHLVNGKVTLVQYKITAVH